MQKPIRYRSRTLFHRHSISLISVPLAVLVSAGILFWYTMYTDAKIENSTKSSAAQLAADDIKIRDIKARKAVELKAQQEAAAKITAESAKIADSSTASTIDSSTCNNANTHNNPSSIDVIVNKKHCLQPVTYAPSDLVDVGEGFLLSAKASDYFTSLMTAASAAGEPLALTSSYRSYGNQVTTYAYWVNISGKDGADTYSARPGYSEHQTGLAFDVADASKQHVLNQFGATSQYQWLLAHAADYGFIQRYYAGYEAITGYSAEEWHYRYVGMAVAKDMQAKGIKTLEQYWGIVGGNYF